VALPFFSRLVQEIQGSELHLVDLSEHMDSVKLKAVDEAGRKKKKKKKKKNSVFTLFLVRTCAYCVRVAERRLSALCSNLSCGSSSRA